MGQLFTTLDQSFVDKQDTPFPIFGGKWWYEKD